ncbi:MAG: hypothetical protein ACE5SW_08335 [Nitrososphaeraceae archaeon]
MQVLKNHKQVTILSIIFLALMIPNVVIYIEHSILEFLESGKSVQNSEINKSTRQFAEGVFFALTAIGYIVCTVLIFVKPNLKIPYYAILIGTVAIMIVYYMRTMTGVPIPGTELIIKEYAIDYRDVITKLAQIGLVIPLAMMLQRLYDIKYKRIEKNTDL